MFRITAFQQQKGAYAWQTGATKSVTANTTYYVYAKDAAGNISAPTTVAVGKIDKTKPTAPTVTGNPSSWAASATLTASATDTGSGIAGYSFSTAENNYTWQTAATKAVVKRNLLCIYQGCGWQYFITNYCYGK